MGASGGGARLTPGLGLAWRFAALAGLACGLGASPLIGLGRPPALPAFATVAIVAGLLALVAPRRDRGGRRPSRTGAQASAWLGFVALLGFACGVGAGSARIAAIDAGALDLGAGARVELHGFVIAVPRRSNGQVSVRVQTSGGRLMVEAPEPVADLDIGTGVRATGTIREPSDFERAYLGRLGIGEVLSTRAIELTDARRGGLQGLLDGIRERAQEALSEGTPAPASNLLRGFVLGQDDRIDEPTVDDFKRSGLAHLLAVSGQNVVLLAILATAALSLLGVPVRTRLIAICALIGVYVLVTGAGPSIQRAGVMGAAAIAAALAGRPRSRWYVLLLAAAATLGLDPRAAEDIGWQLSFAAVLGILLFCAPLGRLLAGSHPTPARRALAEAAALTISATLATAPLMSFHFGTVSVVSLPANLLAAVAEAPVMWLGMIAAGAGQLDWFPVEPITWLAGLIAAYIAQVAGWFAAPAWAQVELGLDGAMALTASYAALGSALALGLRWARRRRDLRIAIVPPARRRRPVGAFAAGLAAVGAIAVVVALARPPAGATRDPPVGLRVSVLDVGQGDSILLEAAGGDPVLVDSGPASAEVAAQLADRGVQRLAALLLTHTDSDHSGGAPDLLAGLPISHLGFARAKRGTLAAAEAAGVETDRIVAGSVLRSGDLRLRVLWPPRSAAEAAGRVGEPNSLSLLILARWHRFRMLLTADAEAELAPVHPGDVDVLEVAHHGSEDAGLPQRLAETDPELALISVGADNPYGHPSPATLSELDQAGIPVLRTDRDGELTISVTRRGWSVDSG